MSAIGSIASYFGGAVAMGIFGNPWFIVGIIYMICVGIGLLSKMSFDGMFLILAIATIISGGYFMPQNMITGIVMVAGGLVAAIAAMRLFRH